MEPLRCDFCNGNLVMDDSREFAVCEFCGTKYLKSTIQSKIQEIKGTVSVVGTVSTKETDFVVRAGVLERYNGAEVNVNIPNSVTTIGESAFMGLPITSVSIPNSVKIIRDGAFYSTELQKVSIPSSVQEIGGCAFSYCQKLTEVFLPGTPIVIKDYAFNCPNLSVIHNIECYPLNAFEHTKWWFDNKARIWASQGRCPYCGGSNFRGLIYKKCSSCGR